MSNRELQLSKRSVFYLVVSRTRNTRDTLGESYHIRGLSLSVHVTSHHHDYHTPNDVIRDIPKRASRSSRRNVPYCRLHICMKVRRSRAEIPKIRKFRTKPVREQVYAKKN